ncbi:Hypothetical predicted protein [Olea europaea subsp. europaea]|uniref:Uncharacterized protein n=1 Tax=Olea europaea subsp. europaea TaxID=158383 RepID=A0A8S0RML7_OLEEU|nr:Hypothetical predicted protein [Olea europaea subsp. europaea]
MQQNHHKTIADRPKNTTNRMIWPTWEGKIDNLKNLRCQLHGHRSSKRPVISSQPDKYNTREPNVCYLWIGVTKSDLHKTPSLPVDWGRRSHRTQIFATCGPRPFSKEEAIDTEVSH